MLCRALLLLDCWPGPALVARLGVVLMLLLLLTLPRTRGTGRMVGSELLPPVKGKKYEKKNCCENLFCCSYQS